MLLVRQKCRREVKSHARRGWLSARKLLAIQPVICMGFASSLARQLPVHLVETKKVYVEARPIIPLHSLPGWSGDRRVWRHCVENRRPGKVWRLPVYGYA